MTEIKWYVKYYENRSTTDVTEETIVGPQNTAEVFAAIKQAYLFARVISVVAL